MAGRGGGAAGQVDEGGEQRAAWPGMGVVAARLERGLELGELGGGPDVGVRVAGVGLDLGLGMTLEGRVGERVSVEGALGALVGDWWSEADSMHLGAPGGAGG